MSGSLFTTACAQAVRDDIRWLEYTTANVVIPTHLQSPADIASIRVPMKAAMDAAPDDNARQAIKASADAEADSIMMAEKFEYAFYSADNTTFMIAVCTSQLPSVPAGYTEYNYTDGQDRMENSGIYDKMIRGIR